MAGALLRRRAIVSAATAATDPYWAAVSALLKFGGADASTTFTDQKGKAWTPSGAAQIDTAFSPFAGAGSMLLDGSTDYISTPSHADFGFGTGDFTIEGFFRATAANTNAVLYDARVAAGASGVVWCSQGGAPGKLGYSTEAGTGFVYGAQSFDTTWRHWAVTRQAGTVRGFVSGALQFTTADARNFVSPQGTFFGSSATASQGAIGNMGECRVTKGVARYTANFTPPTVEFPTLAGPVAIWNPSDCNVDLSLSAAALTAALSGTAGFLRSVRASIGRSAGVHSFAVNNVGGTFKMMGFATAAGSLAGTYYPGVDLNSYGYEQSAGNKYRNGSGSAYGATYTTGNVITGEINFTAGTITFYKDGVSQGTAFSGITPGTYYPCVGVANAGSAWAADFTNW